MRIRGSHLFIGFSGLGKIFRQWNEWLSVSLTEFWQIHRAMQCKSPRRVEMVAFNIVCFTQGCWAWGHQSPFWQLLLSWNFSCRSVLCVIELCTHDIKQHKFWHVCSFIAHCFFIFLILFIYMKVLTGCLYIYYKHAWWPWRSEEGVRVPGMKWQMAVCQHVDGQIEPRSSAEQ